MTKNDRFKVVSVYIGEKTLSVETLFDDGSPYVDEINRVESEGAYLFSSLIPVHGGYPAILFEKV